MVKILSDYSLKKHNTFRLNVTAKYFATVHSLEDIQELIKQPEFKKGPVLILGDGANILFTKDYPGLVIHPEFLGQKILEETSDHIVLELGAAEDWHKTVMYTVENGWGGIENLVYIPGTVGAAPIQNIAAYGQNLVDSFDSLDAVELATGTLKRFSKEECHFTYRSSIFKNELKGKYLVVTVRLRLMKNANVDATYFEFGNNANRQTISIEEELRKIAQPPYTVKDVANAVMVIRKRKLPNIHEVGTAGSFFANPVVTKKHLKELQKKIEFLQFYPVDQLSYPKLDDPKLTHDDYVKLPAARLIDEAGWRGQRHGDVGSYPNQALCLVNYGNATGQEVLDFANEIKRDIFEKYGVKLEYEINVI